MEKQVSRIRSKRSVFQLKISPLLFWSLIVGLCFLNTNISLVQTATCPSSMSSSAVKITEQYSFTGYTYSYSYGVIGGPVSNNLYYMYFVIFPDNTIIRKVNASDSQSWQTSIPLKTSAKSLSVDDAEKSLYFSSTDNPVTVIRLSASDGSVISQHV